MFLLLIIWGIAELGARFAPRVGEAPPVSDGAIDTTLEDSSDVTDTTGLGLQVPDGFRIDLFADNLQRPRVLLEDEMGVLVVSDQSAGAVVAVPDGNHDGLADTKDILIEGLNGPHGLAFLPDGTLAVAEEQRVGVWRYSSDTFDWVFDRQLAELPEGGNHVTRTIQVVGDYVYITIGSSCNLCVEDDARRATMLKVRLDGSELQTWATGLRNTTFFVPDPTDAGYFWGNDMGRDYLGDNLPPDELNRIPVAGDGELTSRDYGWPYCYGDRVVDPFGHSQERCDTTVGSHYDYPAHVAPLGLRFIPAGLGWPADWAGDLLVAWHGSWNRSEKIGYKVVRLELNADREVVAVHNFVTGFAKDDGTVVGRPADLYFAADGALYISDDDGGRILRVKPM